MRRERYYEDDEPYYQPRRPTGLLRGLACLCVAVGVCSYVLLNWPALKAHAPAIVSQPSPVASPKPSPARPTPARNVGGSYNDASAADAAYKTSVAQQAATPDASTATPAFCAVATWPNGSQSCDDGRPIDADHSQPGFCKLIDLEGGLWCENEAAPGTIIATPIPSDPTPVPAYVQPSSAVTYTAADGPDGSTCVTVTFGDGHAQTACSESGVKYNQANIDYVGQMIESGQIQPGHNAPKG